MVLSSWHTLDVAQVWPHVMYGIILFEYMTSMYPFRARIWSISHKALSDTVKYAQIRIRDNSHENLCAEYSSKILSNPTSDTSTCHWVLSSRKFSILCVAFIILLHNIVWWGDDLLFTLRSLFPVNLLCGWKVAAISIKSNKSKYRMLERAGPTHVRGHGCSCPSGTRLKQAISLLILSIWFISYCFVEKSGSHNIVNLQHLWKLNPFPCCLGFYLFSFAKNLLVHGTE